MTLAQVFGDRILKADWAPFMGNNHAMMPYTGSQFGGMVSFTRQLSQALWEDLLYRLRITSLRIYRPSEPQWTDGRWQSCDIYLDADGQVTEISYAP